jgi:hypothetical protein
LGLRSRRDKDIGAGFGESQRDGRTEAAAATSDDGDFVVETEPVEDHCGLSFELSDETVASLAVSDRGISETGSSLAYGQDDAASPMSEVAPRFDSRQNSPGVNLVAVSFMAASDTAGRQAAATGGAGHLLIRTVQRI